MENELNERGVGGHTPHGRAQKVKFDSEVEAIRLRYGGLEQMRAQLGLSRRSLCEQLMVDPSAWSRWVTMREGRVTESAPPHVYKMLALLVDKFEKDNFTKKNFSSEPVQSPEAPVTHVRYKKVSVTRAAAENEVTLGWKFLLLVTLILAIYGLLN